MGFLDKVKEAGIIGAGGAGFPTHIKLSSKAEYIILNGAESEPLLQKDVELMKKYGHEIIQGFEMARQLVGADKAFVAIKEKHRETKSGLERSVKELELDGHMVVKGLADVYPVGDETVLVYEVTGRVVPELGLPISVGCVVINVETALNIYKAAKGRSVVDKYITITGDVPNSLTVRVPVGTPIIEVLKLSGIENFEDYRVINGGPMMGYVMEGLDGYVGKTSGGFIILKKDHYLIRRKTMDMAGARRLSRSVCEQCRMCTDLCPRYLMGHNMQAHKIMRSLNYGLKDLDMINTVQLCSECNLCELFACQSGLYPRMVNKYYKEKLAQQNIRYKARTEELKAFDNRAYRLISTERLMARLDLIDYAKPASMEEIQLEPSLVRISTKEHIGKPVDPIVSVGDSVKLGQLVGEANTDGVWASIHASIDGTVVNVDRDFVEIRRK